MTSEPSQARSSAPPREVPVRGFEGAYRDETRLLLVERTRIALSVGGALYLMFGALDKLVVPQHALRFLPVRFGVAVLAWCVVVSLRAAVAREYVLELLVSVLVVASLGISGMTAVLGGFASDYYLGLMLVLFFVGFFMPWSPVVAAVFSGLVIGPYVVWNAVAHGFSDRAITPLFFLSSTALYTCIAVAMNDTQRRRDLALRLQLESANDDLKQLDEAKTRFFANVSHELRTPLMLILGPLETLLRDSGSHGSRHLLETMSSNAQRLLRQVNTLLDFARIEADRLTCRLATGNAGEIAARLAFAAGPYAERRGIALEVRGLDDIPSSELDAEKIETVIANLLSNALKFTPDGGAVKVLGSSDDSHVFIEVIDTGVGIPAEHLDRIFERFHQVDDGTHGKTEGTGLGLSLAQELVQLHNGKIEVTSELGRGSSFRVTLPRHPRLSPNRRQKPRRRADRIAQAHLDSALTAYQSRHSPATLFADVALPAGPLEVDVLPKGPTDGARVLVVEDHVELRRFIAERLSKSYRVTTASDGEAALAAVQEQAPDLVVTDRMMPRMDGIELCKALRRTPGLERVPILLLTARSGTEAVVEGLSAGADDYVVKPFDVQELEARIAAHLRARLAERRLVERESRLAAIGRMTSTLVHDLRNPLNAVLGHTELAKMSLDDAASPADVSEDLEAVLGATARALRLTEEMLSYAREGTELLHLESVSIEELAREVIAEAENRARGTGVAFVIETSGEGGFVAKIDREKIRRVLENLVGNAREAVQTVLGSERRVSIHVGRERDGVCIRVADTGPGIPAEVRERLFQPFVTGRKHGGTGLGLATARNLATAHGGSLVLEPSERGATFRLLVPAAAPVAIRAPTPAA